MCKTTEIDSKKLIKKKMSCAENFKSNILFASVSVLYFIFFFVRFP